MTSEQERLIDQYRRQGMGSTEIAARLNLSVNTVKSYFRRTTVETAGKGNEAAPSGVCEQCGKLMTQTGQAWEAILF